MSGELFDRGRLRFRPLAERRNKVRIERDQVSPEAPPSGLGAEARLRVAEAAEAVRSARAGGRAVILAFGAHAIKNGLAPVLIRLAERGWLTHLATNGAGVIHDWEFAYQGASSEDVRENLARGQFGLWQETGLYLNLALAVGAHAGLGYGESVGSLVQREGLDIPDREALAAEARSLAAERPEQAAAAADLLAVLGRLGPPSGLPPWDFQPPGFLEVPHPWKRFGLQAAAFRLGLPFTAHPMFGHDIIYAHPASSGAALGRAAERDFLAFVSSVAGLSGGVYLSVGSAVMSPMIFEKALSMARNAALAQGRRVEDFRIFVVDLAPLSWDWQRDGEPPPEHPAYYLRFMKTFSRAGAPVAYVQADNRAFLAGLCAELGDNPL
jgi:hypothetical protein